MDHRVHWRRQSCATRGRAIFVGGNLVEAFVFLQDVRLGVVGGVQCLDHLVDGLVLAHLNGEASAKRNAFRAEENELALNAFDNAGKPGGRIGDFGIGRARADRSTPGKAAAGNGVGVRILLYQLVELIGHCGDAGGAVGHALVSSVEEKLGGEGFGGATNKLQHWGIEAGNGNLRELRSLE